MKSRKMRDRYMYHVTYDGRLDDIATRGLKAGSPRGIGGKVFDIHRRGAIFLTDADGLSFWFERAEEWANHASDDTLSDGLTPVALRLPRASLEDFCEEDIIGTRDAGRTAYRCEADVEPESIDLWNGSDWVDVGRGVRSVDAYDAWQDDTGSTIYSLLFHLENPLYPLDEDLEKPRRDDVRKRAALRKKQAEAAAMKRRKSTHRNPVGFRLGFVEQQYGPQVADVVLDVVLTAPEDPPEADAAASWEDQIPELARRINRVFRDLRRGRIGEDQAQAQLEGLRLEFCDLVREHERVAAMAPALTPKELRTRIAQGDPLRGAEFVADLGEGYTAVMATPDLDAPRFPGGNRDEPTPAMVDWVERHAPFQQHMGVSMNNCLQFYRVNYMPYGAGKFETQRQGGKLYAVLDPRGRPVAATLTDANGTVIETNGRGNKPPRGADAQALVRFEVLMGWDTSARGVFDVPGVDERVSSAVEYVLDQVYEDGPERAEYLERATAAARQAGFDSERVVRDWLIYLLVESPYSARRSVARSQYERSDDVIAAIDAVADALRSGDEEALRAARDAARSAAAADAAAAAATYAADAASYVYAITADAAALAAQTAADAAAAQTADTYVASKDYADTLIRIMEAEANRAECGVAQAPAANPAIAEIKRRLLR